MPDNTAPGAPGTKRLRNARIIETSGVDHPAHMHPGWLLKKSLGSDKAEALAVAFGKERNMPENKTAPVLTGLLKSLAGVTDRAEICKALSAADEVAIKKEITESDIAPLRDGLAELWKVARDLSDKGNPDTPSADAPAATPAAPDAASVLASADLQKAIGPAGVALFKEMHENSVRIAKELEDERAHAFEKSITAEFGDIIDAADIPTLSKSLRSMDAAAAAIVRTALTKTKELNSSAEAIITKEIGGAGRASDGSAEAQLNAIAKAEVDAGRETNFSIAFSKAAESHPALYERMSKEG